MEANIIYVMEQILNGMAINSMAKKCWHCGENPKQGGGGRGGEAVYVFLPNSSDWYIA